MTVEFYCIQDEGELMTGAGMAGLTYFTSNNDDPYITMKNIVSDLYIFMILFLKHFQSESNMNRLLSSNSFV